MQKTKIQQYIQLTTGYMVKSQANLLNIKKKDNFP